MLQLTDWGGLSFNRIMIPRGRLGIVAHPTAGQRPFGIVGIVPSDRRGEQPQMVIEISYAELLRCKAHYERLIGQRDVDRHVSTERL